MKSGLEGRNNLTAGPFHGWFRFVSMKSGLEGRNNWDTSPPFKGYTMSQ